MVGRVLSVPTRGSGLHSSVINQDHLKASLHQIFPYDDILINTRKGSSIVNPATGKYLELDLWIPVLGLCFEFQDDYHYITTWYAHDPVDTIKSADSVKRESILKRKTTLIVVPCWWNGSSESLLASVHFHRPDLLFDRKASHPPIPLNPPRFLKAGSVPHVGELMLASYPHFTNFHLSISPRNSWWMGEKYDGVRFCWNVIKRKLYSRYGIIIDLPPHFKAQFPNGFIDGELWFGRGFFPDTQKILHAPIDLINFQFLRVVTFDVPPAEALNLGFEKRFRFLLKLIPSNHPFMNAAGRMLCRSHRQLTLAIQEITQDGGEGVILRKPQSLYENGRSPYLLKLKATRGDKEAIVIEVTRAGSIRIKLPDGKSLLVPSYNVELPEPPKPGDVISFNYETYSSKDLPANPKIYRIRKDVVWDDILEDFAQPQPQPQELNETSTRPAGHSQRTSGFWVTQGGKNARAFFEKLARKKGLDPLSPSTWYSFKREWVEAVKGGATILEQYKGGLVNTFLMLFPDIGLDETQFQIRNQFFHDVRNRRQWFENFAKRNKFDPRVASNWYPITSEKIFSEKGARTVMRHHKSSFIRALVSLYPEIEFDKTKFSSPIVMYYAEPAHRKEFFLEVAKERGFDPLVPENWYPLTRLNLVATMKGAQTVMSYYGYSMVKALLALFPDIGLDESNFVTVPRNHFADTNNTRKLYEDFARQRGFDPLVAENWYPITYMQLRSAKGMRSIFNHDCNFTKALKKLFPEVPFDEFKFKQVGMWDDVQNRKKAFDRVAADLQIDPLYMANWYALPRQTLSKYKGISTILLRYRSNLRKALESAYPNIIAINKLKTR
jgi:DNA ligase-1